MLNETLRHLMWASGALASFRLINRAKLLILTYHRFTEHDNGIDTSAAHLRKQLEYLTARYKIMGLDEIADRLASSGSLPPGSMAITIDDGYRDAYEIAFPLLVKYQAPASFFVVTDFVDRKTWLWTDKLRVATTHTRQNVLETEIDGCKLRWELRDHASRREAAERVNAVLKTLPDEVKEETLARTLSLLGVELPQLPPEEFSAVTWNELRQMEAAGMQIGSHTVTHPVLTKVNDERLYREVHESRLRLTGLLGHPIGQFCYPAGAYDERVKEAVLREGYRCVATTKRGLNDRGCNTMALLRIHAERDLPRFAQSSCGIEPLIKKLRRL